MIQTRSLARRLGISFVLLAPVAVLLYGCGQGSAEPKLVEYQPSQTSTETSEKNSSAEPKIAETETVEASAVEEEKEGELSIADQAAEDVDAPAKSADNEIPVVPAEVTPAEKAADTNNVEQVADNVPKGQTANRVGDIKPLEIPGENPTIATSATSSEPREVKLLVPENSFQVEGPEKALRVSYDDLDLLKVLNMDPVSLDATKSFPKWLKDLDGKRIRLRGFMYPPYAHTDLGAFVLARDNEICCFGRNPKPYDVIQIVMRKDKKVDYIQNRPFDVVGTFHIDLLSYDDKKVDGLYLIDDAIVID